MKIKFTEDYKEWSRKRMEMVGLSDAPFDLDGEHIALRDLNGDFVVYAKTGIVGTLELDIKKESIIVIKED